MASIANLHVQCELCKQTITVTLETTICVAINKADEGADVQVNTTPDYSDLWAHRFIHAERGETESYRLLS